jgi:hypothetical protein
VGLSRRRLALVTVVAIAVVIASGALAAGSPGPSAVASGQRTYAKFGLVAQYKPSTFSFGAYEQITGMTWSKWGRKLARGTGTYQVNDCVPNCAEGTITPTPASVVLSGRQLCGKRFLFHRMKVFFRGRKTGTTAFCLKS